MSEPSNFRKKYLVPVTYCAVVALALWSGTAMVGNFQNGQSPFGYSANVASIATATLEPAAGDEIQATDDKTMPSVTADVLQNATTLDELGLISTDVVQADAKELPPLRISPDKPEIIQLDRDAVNVLVGSEETLRAVPDTNRTIVLIPKKPGATFFKATDADGKIIMQRHVIVGSPATGASQYIRVRRACAGDDKNCKQFSVYYCPDMCHEVNVVQGAEGSGNMTTPDVAPAPAMEEPSYSEPVQNTEPTPQ